MQQADEAARQRGSKITYTLTTNGTLLDDETIELITKRKFGLMVSMDGPREVQDANRPFADGRGSFEIVAANVKKLLRRRKHLTVRCTISRLCLEKALIVGFFDQFGFTRVAISPCLAKPHAPGEFDIDAQGMAELSRQDRILLQNMLAKIRAGLPVRSNPYVKLLQDIHRAGPRLSAVRCGVGRGCTTVGVDGELYPCHRYMGAAKYVIGDVWRGVDTEKLRDYYLKYFSVVKLCHKCWAFRVCGGPCAWYVSREDGAMIPPGTAHCHEIKTWIERSAWLYEVLRTESDVS